MITTLCRIKSWRGQTLGPQLCCVRGLKHQDRHKGSPLFKIKAPCFRGFVLVGLSVCIRADSSWLAVIVFSQETVFASGEILVFPPSESSVQCPVGGRKERNHNSTSDIQGFFYLGL